MNSEPITTRFEVDISDLKANIQEANRQIKLANSEFKAASSGMDNWANSADGLSAKIKQLTSVQDAQQTTLDALKQQYAMVVEQEGEASAGAQNLMIRINNQQAALNKTTNELNSYNAKLDEMQNSSNESMSASQRLRNEISQQESELNDLKSAYQDVVLEQGSTSDEAQELASKITALNSDLQANQQRLDEAANEADQLTMSLGDVGDSAGESSGGFTIMKGALADLVSNGIQWGISKLGEFVGALFETVEATKEYRTMMAKVSGSAEQFGYSIDFAKGKYQEFYSYVGDEQMATNAITNLMGLGLATEDVSNLANGAIATWTAYGDSIPIESLTESMAESIKVGQVTGTLADTINWASLTQQEWNSALGEGSEAQKAFNDAVAAGETQEDAFSAALATTTDTSERARMVAGLLQSTYGQSKLTYEETAGSILEANEAQAKLTESQAQLAEAVTPLTTAFTNFKAQALEALAPVVQNVANSFSDLLGWLQEHPTVLTIITSLVSGLAVAFGVLAGALAIQALIKGVTTAFAALNAVLAANPFILIATLIAGIVAALITLWNTNEGFRNAVTEIWNGIMSVIGPIIDGIVNFFTVTIPGAIQSMITWFQNIPTNISNFLNTAWTTVTTWVSNMVSKALELGSQFLQNIITFFSQLPYNIGYLLGMVIGTVASWVVNMVNSAIQMGQQFLQNVINFFMQLPTNIANFLTSAWNAVTTWVGNMVNSAIQAGSQFVSNVISFLSSLPGQVAQWLSNVVSSALSFVSNFASKAIEAASQFVSNITSGLADLPGQMLSIGSDIVHGIWDGISGAAGWLMDQIGGFASGVVDGIADFFGIGSPSKEMRDKVGKWLPPGIGVGIKKNAKEALQPMKALASDMIDEATQMQDAMNLDNMKVKLSSSVGSLKSKLSSGAQAVQEQAQQIRDVVFNQYNNSPKALSRFEIYRQTKSQLFAAKGRLKYV